jgi:hypothetical protein
MNPKERQEAIYDHLKDYSGDWRTFYGIYLASERTQRRDLKALMEAGRIERGKPGQYRISLWVDAPTGEGMWWMRRKDRADIVVICDKHPDGNPNPMLRVEGIASCSRVPLQSIKRNYPDARFQRAQSPKG